MSSRKRKKFQRFPLSKHQYIAIDPDVFTEAFNVAMANVNDPTPTSDLLLPSLILTDRGEEQNIRFLDTPMFRIVSTMLSHYRSDDIGSISACIRALALLTVIHTEEIRDWTMLIGEQIAIADVVIATAATAPLNNSLNFSPADFVAEVRRRETEAQ